jgi:type II secretory pathway component HofQ
VTRRHALRAALLGGDVGEADELVARQRRAAAQAGREAEERRRRAATHAGGPGDPRAQGLWDAAAYHAERARLAEVELAAMERRAAQIRAWAAAARRAAEGGGEGGVRPCA